AAATLGILKAGASCVPLDPNYPAGRLAFMLEDAGVSLVLVDGSTSTTLREQSARVFDLSGEADAGGSYSATPLREAVDPDATAYVIYTSGSTGIPRGVELTH